MLWQKITLTKSQIESGAAQQVRSDFDRAYKDAGRPTDASLLVSKTTDPAGDIEIYFSPRAGDIEIYFSPRAGDIAQRLIDSFSGVPCNVPPASEVESFNQSRILNWSG
jgi:hypothetical protein